MLGMLGIVGNVGLRDLRVDGLGTKGLRDVGDSRDYRV